MRRGGVLCLHAVACHSVGSHDTVHWRSAAKVIRMAVHMCWFWPCVLVYLVLAQAMLLQFTKKGAGQITLAMH